MYKILFVSLIFTIQPAWSYISVGPEDQKRIIFEDNQVFIDGENLLTITGAEQGTVVIKRGDDEIRPIVIEEEEDFLKISGAEQGTVVIEREDDEIRPIVIEEEEDFLKISGAGQGSVVIERGGDVIRLIVIDGEDSPKPKVIEPDGEDSPKVTGPEQDTG